MDEFYLEQALDSRIDDALISLRQEALEFPNASPEALVSRAVKAFSFPVQDLDEPQRNVGMGTSTNTFSRAILGPKLMEANELILEHFVLDSQDLAFQQVRISGSTLQATVDASYSPGRVHAALERAIEDLSGWSKRANLRLVRALESAAEPSASRFVEPPAPARWDVPALAPAPLADEQVRIVAAAEIEASFAALIASADKDANAQEVIDYLLAPVTRFLVSALRSEPDFEAWWRWNRDEIVRAGDRLDATSQVAKAYNWTGDKLEKLALFGGVVQALLYIHAGAAWVMHGA